MNKMKMMSLIFKKLSVLFLGLVLVIYHGNGQTYSEIKKIIRSFPVNPETRLDISNKYGKIQVAQWEKDSVRLEIEVSIKSSSLGKLEKIMDNIDIEFTGTNYYVIANTRFGNTNSAFFTDLMDLSGAIIPSKNQVEINYMVMAPSFMNVNLSNKFGNIYLDDMSGNVTVSLSNGDIKINRLDGESNINVNFGNGIINYLKDAKLNLSYADFDIRNAGQINLTSKSSKIRIERIEILKTESARDKYFISEINNLFGESYFSDLQIYKLNKEADFTSRYGDFTADSVAMNFSFINLQSEYTDIDMTFNQNSSYMIEIIHNPEVTLRIPANFPDLKKVTGSSGEINISGRIGNPNSSSRVEITAPKKCTIAINQRRM